MKHQKTQWLMYKIHSKRLADSKWDLSLPLPDARILGEVVTISNSQLLRWIFELRGVKNPEEQVRDLRMEIQQIRGLPQNKYLTMSMRRTQSKLESLLFIPECVSIIMDSKSDYRRACKGFKINGMQYSRFVGTPTGIKNSTIIFVKADIADELKGRTDNMRNPDLPHIPAKLDAYRALVCSDTFPVSMPRGIIVVPDCETTFKDNVISIRDDNDGGEPILEYQNDVDITLNASDGCGMILPSLAERWSIEYGLDYTSSGFNIRYAFTKGMVFAFDFIEFANKIACNKYITDVWGNTQDITQAELILTASQLKLWESYKSIEDFINCSNANKFTFGISKNCTDELDEERRFNYQFLSSYDLTDEQIEELVKPTVDEYKEVLFGDYRKAMTALMGGTINESYFYSKENNFAKGMLIDDSLYNDKIARGLLHDIIKSRINDAKIGKINIDGNYAMVSGDLFALCQSIFGLEITGILKRDELFSQHWLDKTVEEVVCYRAPMSVHNNIRVMQVSQSEDAQYWYRHMPTVMVVNAWDTVMIAANGMDKQCPLYQ